MAQGAYFNRSKKCKQRIFKKRQRRTRRHTKKQGGGDFSCLFIRPDDGFGNHLYIYAAGVALSKITGKQLCLLPKTLNPHSSKNYRVFMDGIQLDETDDIKKRYSSAPAIVPKPDRFYRTFSKETIRMGSGDMKLETDYYQNFTPIMPYIKDIKNTLFNKEFNKDIYIKYNSTIDSNTSVFMHVRRGDYLIHNWHNEESYFKNALTKLSEFKNIKYIYILSDDIDWCRKQEGVWKKIVPEFNIEYKDIPDELEAFYFMTLCKAGAIISSSSFSAWAAMLGAEQNPKSVIIYPKINMCQKNKFPNDPIENIHGFPSDWIAV